MKRLALLLSINASLACAATWYVTVAGLGGEPLYDQRFAALAKDLEKIVSSQGTSITLTGQAATREAVKSALARIAATAKPDDTIVLTLIGHGTFDGVEYKFNVPGPDISGADLRDWLEKIAARQLIVNTTSASGATLDLLRRPNTVVITATRSGMQYHATVFARFWVEALRDAAADTDKNDTVSALEAYRYADKKTAQYYETLKRLASEQAMLEDTGKGSGVRNPGPENGEGLLAARFPVITTGQVQARYADPAKRKLLERKEAIETKIDELKYEKAALPQDVYQKRLQALLIELATITEELDK